MYCSGSAPAAAGTGIATAMAALTLVGLVGPPASAQVTAFDCLPPAAPYADLPEGVAATYRAELRSDYAAYFDAAQKYLICLDRAQTTVRTELDAALESYEWLFGAE